MRTSIVTRTVLGLLVVVGSLVGLAGNAYAMTPTPRGGTSADTLPASGTTFGTELHWMATGAAITLVVVAVVALALLVSRRQRTGVRHLEAQ